MKIHLVILAVLMLSFSVAATIDTLQFDSASQQQQYRELTASLRCPKCQNNSIADSNSMIAADMRLKVYQLMKQGQSKAQITHYMVARYGNFVTYEPPLTPATFILWGAPALFVLVGASFIIRRSRKGRMAKPDALDTTQQQRLDALLRNNRKSS